MGRKIKRRAGLLQVLFVLAVICQANGTPVDVNLYSSTTIDSGEYGTVNIFDTPPDQTIVDMIGGDIEYCNIYDTANLNVANGVIQTLSAYNSSNVNVDGGNVYLSKFNGNSIGIINNGIFDLTYLVDDSEIHVYGGVWSAGTDIDIFIYENAELHIYGKELDYIDDYVLGVRILDAITGYWENDEEFIIVFSGPSADNFFLHEIPEPTTLLLLGLGGLVLRKRLAR